MPSRTATRESSSRQVTNILHTLRGEQYRHEQNLQRTNARAPVSSSYNNPTLPFDQIYRERPMRREPSPPPARQPPPIRIGPEGVLEYAYPRGRVPGPRPPRSWSGLFRDEQEGSSEDEEYVWRSNALSLMYSHIAPSPGSDGASVPRLTLLCSRYLVSLYPGQDALKEFAEDVVPYLPGHLRRDLIRWSAVNDPLHTTKLTALTEPDGHVDGELIVVGPQASLPRDVFRTRRPLLQNTPHAAAATRIVPKQAPDYEALESWDSPTSEERAPQPMQALVILSTSVLVNMLLAFPPTLTHLALLALPTSTPIFRLPRICPLIEVLDISFNRWLTLPHAGTESVLQRVEWHRWSRLKVLGLTGTGVGEEIIPRVNTGRWVDVDIVGIVSLKDAMSNITLGL
ncbi:hypothetical protein C8Q72DRAFT_801428 [Fomitopsis betulina]|nr:hypothetical protein C8Q72DRAFT_844669 [Fomitopsis betulina]KAI0736744.1 hypothetical protein C8Q72DRAFT_801428 [Fomitopsis betulina]